MTILIIEDNRQMRQVIKSFLRDLAENMFECNDGSGALSAYDECRPDWVLIDLEVPGMDGLTTIRQIKGTFPGAKIVILSNYNGSDLYAAAKGAGASACIAKEDLLALRNILIESE